MSVRDEPMRFSKKADMIVNANNGMKNDLALLSDDIAKKEK